MVWVIGPLLVVRVIGPYPRTNLTGNQFSSGSLYKIMDIETLWNGDFWSKTVFLKQQNFNNSGNNSGKHFFLRYRFGIYFCFVFVYTYFFVIQFFKDKYIFVWIFLTISYIIL